MKPPRWLLQDADRVERALLVALAKRAHGVPSRLLDAMRYALTGGKRVRAGLVLACTRACNGNDALAIAAACAVECIHAYSLVHDDLPAMDDDEQRRGQPSCWKAFDEATAILAGDALQAWAFEWIANETRLAATLRTELIATLAEAAGDRGMVGGQMLDLLAEGKKPETIAEIERIHLRKTGALIRWCCTAGARIAAASPEQLAACTRFGEAIGLLFQIADDVLDATASSETLGKTAGKDARQGKATYVSLLGLARARKVGEEWLNQAKAALAALPHPEELKELADFVWNREK